MVPRRETWPACRIIPQSSSSGARDGAEIPNAYPIYAAMDFFHHDVRLLSHGVLFRPSSIHVNVPVFYGNMRQIYSP